MFQLAYIIVGSWIGFIAYNQTLEVLCEGKEPETADYVIALAVTFAAILGWVLFLAFALVSRFRTRSR